MSYDWRTALAAPLFIPGGDTWEPYVYYRPDKSPVTVCGSGKAILVVPGGFANSETEHYESKYVTFPEKKFDKLASGKATDNILSAQTDPLGATTVAALRAAAGEPLEKKYSEQPCDACNGSGIYKCYACDHESDCEECDGEGTTTGVDVPPTHYIDFAGSLVDAQQVAPLFARVPDGAVEIRSRREAAKSVQLYLVGADWQIVIATMVPDANPDGERVQLLLSPNVPVQPCPTSAAPC